MYKRYLTRDLKQEHIENCRPLKTHFVFPQFQVFFTTLAMATSTPAEITWWPLTLHDPTVRKTVCAYREWCTVCRREKPSSMSFSWIPVGNGRPAGTWWSCATICLLKNVYLEFQIFEIVLEMLHAATLFNVFAILYPPGTNKKVLPLKLSLRLLWATLCMDTPRKYWQFL